MKVLNWLEYSSFYDQQHQASIPKKPEVATVKLYYFVPLIIGVIAINFLSGAHTIPFISGLVETEHKILKDFLGVMGFLSMEFMLISLMLIAYDSVIRYFVIILAFVAILAANIVMTINASNTNFVNIVDNQDIRNAIGVLMGLFVPCSNLATGEALRHLIDKRATENNALISEWQNEIQSYEQKKRGAYTLYLKKSGIRNATEALLYGSGMDSDTIQNTINDSERIAVQDSDSSAKVVMDSGKSSAELLADRLIADGNVNMPQSQIRLVYKCSPNTASKAVNIAKNKNTPI